MHKHPEFKEVLIDATEQETYKPKAKEKRQGNFSGKKKRHTLKLQVTTSRGGLLLHVSRSLDLIQKWANGLHNRYRAPVENALAHPKRFKLLAGIYRGPQRSYDDTFLGRTRDDPPTRRRARLGRNSA